MTNKRRLACYKKSSSNKHYKRDLSWEESNTKNTLIEGLVNRVLNDKSESKNNTMVYGYYPKVLKDYGCALLS